MKKSRLRKLFAVTLALLLVLSSATSVFAASSSKSKPAKVTISSATYNQSDNLVVKWKKVSKNCSGYQIQYAENSKFNSGKVTVTVKSKNTTSKIIKNTNADDEYGGAVSVRVRAYNIVNGKKIYGTWSKVQLARTQRNRTAVNCLKLYTALSSKQDRAVEMEYEKSNNYARGSIQAVAPNNFYFVYVDMTSNHLFGITMELKQEENGDFYADVVMDANFANGDYGIDAENYDGAITMHFNPIKDLGKTSDIPYTLSNLSSYGKKFFKAENDEYVGLMLESALAYWNLILYKNTGYKMEDIGFMNMIES